jgi:hypothetical protein
LRKRRENLYGIIKQHNGFIIVDSTIGKGTTFKIYLPVYRGQVELKEKVTAASPGKTGTETVLLAEDEEAGEVVRIILYSSYKDFHAPILRRVFRGLTHVMRKTKNDLIKLQVAGFYRDIDLGEPMRVMDEMEKEKAREQGFTASMDTRFQLLEMHVNLDLEGYEDKDKHGEPTGIALPYVVTIEKGTGTILAIRRNWKEETHSRVSGAESVSNGIHRSLCVLPFPHQTDRNRTPGPTDMVMASSSMDCSSFIRFRSMRIPPLRVIARPP